MILEKLSLLSVKSGFCSKDIRMLFKLMLSVLFLSISALMTCHADDDKLMTKEDKIMEQYKKKKLEIRKKYDLERSKTWEDMDKSDEECLNKMSKLIKQPHAIRENWLKQCKTNDGVWLKKIIDLDEQEYEDLLALEEMLEQTSDKIDVSANSPLA